MMLTAYDIHVMAAACGIPHVDITSPYVGTVDISAERPRNVHPRAWSAWCFMFQCWIDAELPLYVAVTFRTEEQIFALRPISVGGYVRPIEGNA